MRIEIFITVFFIAIVAGVFWLSMTHSNAVNERKNWCEEAGGIPVVGDKGHYKICLDPSAVIERPL
jgi:hypothetical protein